MVETEIDHNFSPLEFVVPSNWFIDRTFWEYIDENLSIPSLCKTRFYIPTTRAKKGWPEKLKQYFSVEPSVSFDSEIINLPNEITAEEIEEHRKGMNKYVVESVKNPVPIGPPEKLSVERYLQSKKFELLFRVDTKEAWESLTPKEKRIYRWTRDYGFLWDHRDGKGTLFPGPRDLKALKFEVISEYFFHVPSFNQLILSVACEPNTDKAIYGFRREARLDWPPDKIWTGVEYAENKKPHPKLANIPDEVVEKNIVFPINKLISNLEYVLSK